MIGADRDLDVAVVIDGSSSMGIWRETTDQVHAALRRSGAFRDVQVWHLVSGDGRSLVLRTPSGQHRRPDELIDHSGRQLIALVTDAVDDRWRAPAGAALLGRWTAHNPMVILQVLAPSMWHRTALPPVPLSGPARNWIPVVGIEAASVDRWAGDFSAGLRRTTMPAVPVGLLPLAAPPSPAASGTPGESVAAFQRLCSATAFRLAGYLAAAPLTLPVARALQTALVPDSRPHHLAEVLLSGLVDRVEPEPADDEEPDAVVYDFRPGVRAELLRTRAAADAFAVLDILADRSPSIAGRLGTVDLFEVADHPERALGSSPLTRLTAEVAVTVLGGFGGAFAAAAGRIGTVLTNAAAPTGPHPAPGRNFDQLVKGIYGRNRELDVLRRALDDTAAGAGGCHLLSGVAGIGKSRLLRAAEDMAGASGIAVAGREAFRPDRAAPLATLGGALRNCNPPTEEFGWLSDLDHYHEPYLVLERLRAALENYAARRPLLVIIDDAHWMDELSALAIRQLVPALASSPVRWLFAYRPDQPDTPGRQTLEWLARAGPSPLSLGPLDASAVSAFCAGRLRATADHTVLTLVSGCGGNPLLIAQLLTALERTGQLRTAGGVASVVGDDLPSGFVDTVRDIVDRLAPDTRQLLRVGSVLARPFDIEAAARLMRRAPADLFEPVEEAMTAGLVIEDADGLVFAHEQVRQAVYNDLRRVVRGQLHRGAAAVARDERRPPAEIAEHLLASGRAGAREAVQLLRTAADQVAPTAPATAADLMLKAIEAAGADDPDRGALIAATVGLLAQAARLGEARELGEQALRAGLDTTTEAELLLGLAEAFKHAGQNPTAVTYADKALVLTGLSDRIRARLHAVRAHALVYVDELAAADVSGDRADRLGRAAGDPAAAVFGLAARSLVAHAQGRLADALDHARVATDLADRAGGDARLRNPRIWLGNALIAADRFDEAERTLRQGRRDSERLGTAWAQPLYHYFQATLLTIRGRLDEATAEADGGLAVAEQLTAYQLAIPLHGVLLRLAVLRGDLAQAQVSLERMRRHAEGGVTVALEDIVYPEALLKAASGIPATGFQLLWSVVDAMPERSLLLANDPSAAAGLVAMAQAAGDPDGAAVVAAAADRLARQNPGSRSAQAAAAHAGGLLRHDPDLLREAVGHYRATDRPLALASALEDAGERTEALDIYTAHHAHGPRRRLERLLGRPADVPRPAKRFLPQLTPSERNVAVLVAEGLTNSQVAERLFLSRHTVDSHLRKIFAKLDLRRRVELASVVVREGGAERGVH